MHSRYNQRALAIVVWFYQTHAFFCFREVILNPFFLLQKVVFLTMFFFYRGWFYNPVFLLQKAYLYTSFPVTEGWFSNTCVYSFLVFLLELGLM